MVVDVTAFCPCPKNLPEVKFKSNEVISLAEEHSREPNIDFVMQFLVITLKQIYSGKKATEQKEIQNILLKRKKKHQGDLMLQLVMKGIRRLIPHLH